MHHDPGVLPCSVHCLEPHPQVGHLPTGQPLTGGLEGREVGHDQWPLGCHTHTHRQHVTTSTCFSTLDRVHFLRGAAAGPGEQSTFTHDQTRHMLLALTVELQIALHVPPWTSREVSRLTVMVVLTCPLSSRQARCLPRGQSSQSNASQGSLPITHLGRPFWLPCQQLL